MMTRFLLGMLILVSIELPSQSATEKLIRIVIIGDSLTDGYGISRENAYPRLVEARLKAEGHPNIEIINAGISGSTSASAEGRLKWQLKNKPKILVLALGANDGLRGIAVSETQKNLAKTIGLAQSNQVQVLLVGMKIPPNFGKEYSTEFEKLFPQLARTYHVSLIPFLLEGVGGHRDLNQEDGIHPNEKGHQKVAETVSPYLEKMISKLESGKPEKQ